MYQQALRNPRRSSACEGGHQPVLPAAGAWPQRSHSPRSRTCCSCVTRWRTSRGRSSAASKAPSSSRRTDTRRRRQRSRQRARRSGDADCRTTCCRHCAEHWIPLLPVQTVARAAGQDPLAPQARRGAAAGRSQGRFTLAEGWDRSARTQAAHVRRGSAARRRADHPPAAPGPVDGRVDLVVDVIQEPGWARGVARAS